MLILGNFLFAAAKIVDIILTVMYWMILVRAIISWVNPDPYNAIVQFLNRVTEPILQPIRRLLPPSVVDISPLIAILAIIFLKSFLVQTLNDLGLQLKY